MADTTPLGPDGFQAAMAVSRETLDRLQIYADLLVKWQKSLNLVGPSTLDDLWRRHMQDSAQLLRFIPEETRSLLDLGSGAGFPGLVLAILGVRGVELVESDQKKAVFLREVSRETGAGVVVHACRIEELAKKSADVVTARALAPLDRLVPMMSRFMGEGSIGLVPKGADVAAELARASLVCHLSYTCHTSMTDSCSTILVINNVWYGGRK
ncbi:MAG: 16S rRNA (guanine(527)-N(7))-methyltransferase RsmG [Pseudomonadota bacterium]